MKITFYIILIIFSYSQLKPQTDRYYESIRLLSSVLNQIKNEYVEEKDPNELIEAAIHGILLKLDPYCAYFKPEIALKQDSIDMGLLFNVGLDFNIIEGAVTVISIQSGSVSENTRISMGDILLEVDSKSVEYINLFELDILLHGLENTSVKLKFLNRNSEEYELKLKRKKHTVVNIPYYFSLHNNIGYINIESFGLNTHTDFIEAYTLLKNKYNINKLILDLRNNPGGYANSTMDIISNFLPNKKLIVSQKGRKKYLDTAYYTAGEAIAMDVPLIVLVNRVSASASELLAVCLQDYDRALIVGTNTVGKASINRKFLLSNYGILYMTIGKYFSPTGRSIQRDYTNLTYLQYLKDVYDTDSASIKNFPTTKTLGGRTIYEGPGVIPDIFIDFPEPPFKDWQYIISDGTLLNFAKKFIADNEAELKQYKDYIAFADNFNLSDAQVQPLLAQILENEKYFDKEKNVQALEFLKVQLKIEIARHTWDRIGEAYVSFQTDVQLQTAINAFDYLEQLLSVSE